LGTGVPELSRVSGMLIGYARVSKGDEQCNALQAKALKAADADGRQLRGVRAGDDP